MISFLNNNKIQILRFIIAGLISSILNLIIYKLVYFLTSNINLSSILGYCVGLLNSFLFSSKWVFAKYRYLSFDKSFIIFALIYILGGTEMTITINFVYRFCNNHIIAWIFGASIAAINNFLFSKYLVFNN